MKYAIIFIITLCCTLASLNVFVEQLKIAQIQQTAESKCIHEFIVMDFERSDIKTDNGSCYYEPNGYYK